MARSEPKGVGRREFLKETAAGAAGMAGGAEAAGAAQQHDHDHHHQVVPDDIALRVRALESILVEKEMIDPADLDAVVDAYENRIGPRNGAQIVARAWTHPEYRARLLADGTAAIAEFGFTGAQGEHMVVVENTPEVHNLVVCTLLLLLSVADAGSAAGLVQVGCLPLARGDRAPRGAARLRDGAARRRRGARLGQHGRDPVPGVAGTAGRDARARRGGARGTRHPRFDDRRRQGSGSVDRFRRHWAAKGGRR